MCGVNNRMPGILCSVRHGLTERLTVGLMPAALFHIGGASHGAALAVTVVIGGGFIFLSRSGRCGAAVSFCEHALAVVLAWLPLSRLIAAAWSGVFDLQRDLPFQYCDLAAAAGAVALWTRRQRFCEIIYFFGLTGTLQGLITPALQEDYPSMAFFTFFIGHGAVVIAALYVVLGMRHTPERGAVRRAMIVTTLYALLAGALNAVLGTNYGFLCRKSPNPSLLDVLGPWPWYLLALWLLALALYSLLWLPFARTRDRRLVGQP